MRHTTTTLTAGAIVLAALNQVYAQYTPPPPPAPFAGFLNEYLRKNDPYMNQWDFGGQARVRYEAKEGFAVQGVAGSLDFRDSGNVGIGTNAPTSKVEIVGAQDALKITGYQPVMTLRDSSFFK